MASPENATSVSLRPEGVDAEGRKIPGQKEILAAWKEEKLFRLSPFVRDCLEILERHPELLDTARPGLELSRALDRAEGAVALRDTLKLVYVLATSGVAPSDERWTAVIKQSEGVLWPEEGAPRER